MITLTTMRVEGIHCSTCVANLKQTAGAVQGIRYADVEADLKTVKIEYDTDVLSLDRVKEIIKSIPGKEFMCGRSFVKDDGK